jgi:hypothetical protein
MLVGTALSLLASSALADDTATVPAKSSEPQPLAAFESSKALTEDELGEQRAKAKIEVEKVTINTQDQDGLVAGNAAVGNTTGQNSIGGDAFVSANGFINTVQNTGNNVLIQSSTIINVSVEQ